MPSSKQQTLAAPAIPTFPRPEARYDGSSQQSTHSLLRTFMQRLVGALQSLFGPAGGQYIDNPNALFYGTATQTLAASNTGYAVTFNQSYLSNLVTLVDSSKITAQVAGIYNFQYNGNLKSTSSGSKDVFLWIRFNGTDVGYSCAPFTVGHGNNSYQRANWNFSINMEADDYLELYWSATSTNVTLSTLAASSPHPAIPGSVCAVMYSSAMPATTPTLP